MPNADLNNILHIASLLGAILLVGRLLTAGLWRNYPVFFWYFVFRIFNTLWPLVISDNWTSQYEDLWIVTEPISWIFHVLVVVELSRLVLNRHKGIYSLLRWAMYGSVALAIGISVVALLPKIQPSQSPDTRLLGFWFAAARGVDLALAVFLLMILFFLSRYPVRLNRNILVHTALFTIFFFGGAFAVFLRTFFAASPPKTTNLILEFVSVGCIYAWVLLLTRRGEEAETSFRHITTAHEEHALRQLENLNTTLLKVSSK